MEVPLKWKEKGLRDEAFEEKLTGSGIIATFFLR
jgi:hypothetical protein